MQRIRRARRSELDPRLRGEFDHAFRAAGKHVHRDEVAAARLLPLAQPGPRQLALQRGKHRVELRSQRRREFFHVPDGRRLVPEEAQGPQLVQLVVTDGLDAETLHYLRSLAVSGGEHRHAAAGESDLARRKEIVRALRIAPGLAGCEDIVQRGLPVQMVHTVGVVPEDLEVRRSALHRPQALHRVVAVTDALRVRVQRHAPDALHARIGDQPLDLVHIRTGSGHAHRNHLEPQRLRDGEVAIVTGTRTQELHLRQRPPRRVAADAEDVEPHQHVVHQIKTRIAADDDPRGIQPEQFSEVAPDFGQPLQRPVVAGVGPVLRPKRSERSVEHVVAEVELVRSRFSPRHIQFELFRFEFPVGGEKLLLQYFQFGFRQIADAHIHDKVRPQ